MDQRRGRSILRREVDIARTQRQPVRLADDGAALYTQAFSIQPHRTLIVNTSTLPGLPGQRGTLTVASDAPYGVLSGKTTAVEPALGFTFDTMLRTRPR